MCATSCAQDIKDNPLFAKSVKSNIRKARRSSGISRPFSISKKDMKDIDSCRIKVYYDVKFVKDTADHAKTYRGSISATTTLTATADCCILTTLCAQ